MLDRRERVPPATRQLGSRCVAASFALSSISVNGEPRSWQGLRPSGFSSATASCCLGAQVKALHAPRCALRSGMPSTGVRSRRPTAGAVLRCRGRPEAPRSRRGRAGAELRHKAPTGTWRRADEGGAAPLRNPPTPLPCPDEGNVSTSALLDSNDAERNALFINAAVDAGRASSNNARYSVPQPARQLHFSSVRGAPATTPQWTTQSAPRFRPAHPNDAVWLHQHAR
jgi:hypothetical protein